MTLEERRAAFQAGVLRALQPGWHLEAQTDTSAVFVRPGPRPNHILHFILTLLTAGVWLVVWFFVAAKGPGKDTRQLLSLDDDGQWRWTELP